MTKQRTFHVNGEKIVIRSRRLTAGGAHGGFSVTINGVKTKHFVLFREEAEDAAFAAWVKVKKMTKTIEIEDRVFLVEKIHDFWRISENGNGESVDFARLSDVHKHVRDLKSVIAEVVPGAVLRNGTEEMISRIIERGELSLIVETKNGDHEKLSVSITGRFIWG